MSILYMILALVVFFALVFWQLSKMTWWQKCCANVSEFMRFKMKFLRIFINPYTASFLLFAVINPWGHNYLSYLKQVDWQSPSERISAVVIGALLAVVIIYMVFKAFTVLQKLGHFIFILVWSAIAFILWTLQVDFVQHAILISVSLIVSYSLWGVIWPRVSRSTHRQATVAGDVEVEDGI